MKKSGTIHSTKEETESKSLNNLNIWSHEASIDITFDKNIYTSPDIVNATITITDQKLIKLDSLIVEIQGFEETSFLYFWNIYFDRIIETNIIFKETVTLLNNDQSARTLSPDKHVFTIAFHLPQGLPSSFRAYRNERIKGVIGYKVIVRAKPTDLYFAKVADQLRRGNRDWPNKTQYFRLINPDEDSSGEPINELRPAYYHKEFNIKQYYFKQFYSIPRGSISATVRLKSNRFRPGQTIYSILTLDTSKFKVEIEGVEVYISTKVELYAGTRNGNFKLSWFELKTPSIKGPPVPPGLKQEVRSMSYKIPEDLPRSFKSEMMQVCHRLAVKFTIPRSRNQELLLMNFNVYGFSTPIQSLVNKGQGDKDFYNARQLNYIINNADDPPPSFDKDV